MSSTSSALPNSPNPSALSTWLSHALFQWQDERLVDEAFNQLRYFRHLLTEQRGDAQAATRHLLQQAIDRLRPEHPDHAAVLQARWLSNEKVELAANRLNLGLSTFHRKRGEALPWVIKQIEQMEATWAATQRQQRVQRLPEPTYGDLWGQQAEITALCALLRSRTAPWLIALTGIGGIGKTTLADATVRQLLDDPTWAGIGWITAPQSLPNAGGAISAPTTPALPTPALLDALAAQLLADPEQNGRRNSSETLALLETLLKREAHLIVIDNLESEIDLQEVLPTLRRLANPSKFLITSRSSYFAASDLHHRVTPELDEATAWALLRAEATLRNIIPILAATNDDLRPIYAAVGGNPLALKLVSGQLRLYALPTVLADLTQARGRRIEELYEHIYRRAWSALEHSAQAVLLAMPLVSEQGGTIELLRAMCELPDDDLDRVLEVLVSLHLVEVRGDLHQRHYTIHSLTRTFLHEQVIRWQQPQQPPTTNSSAI